jgi:iron complex outermembrane recepter protein
LKSSWKLSTAIVAATMLGAGAVPAFAQETAAQADSTDDGSIADIVVTATRRSEALNKIPLAIQALNGDALNKLNVTNFEKLIEFLPNVRTASHGPGTSSIFIRGLSTDSPGLQISGTAGTAPSVALYINDAPASLVGRNIDLYAADLSRVEVLAGPQGTLFGASSMGGAVRYITNKPDLNEFHAGFNGSYSMTKGGDDSVAGDVFINIPIIEDRFAVRAVFYNDNQGGYIDNVAGTYQMPFDAHVGQAGRLPTGNPLLVMRAIQSCQTSATTVLANCNGSQYLNGGLGPVRGTINNDRFVENNYNDASYRGGRIEATFKINDDWSINAMHVRQQLNTDGAFDYEPGVGDLKVTQFNENSLKDKFDMTTWTINGRLGFLDLIYTGSYLNHSAVQKADYASYSNIGLFLPYYECDAGIYYSNPDYALPTRCYNPNKSYQVRNKTQRTTHEFRVTTPAAERIRATAGVFYDVNKLFDNTDWSYAQQDAGFIYPRSPDPAVNAYDNSIRPVAVGFFNDVQRRDRQFAIYGEASFDIVPEKLTITGGARYYNEKASMNGSSSTSFCGAARGVYDPATGTYSAAAVPTTNYCISANLNVLLASVSPKTYSGVLFKGNLTYKFGEGSLVYATYSEGFRPGGFNRKPCTPGRSFGNPSTLCTPAVFADLAVYVPDEVKNYEIGGKFALLNRTLQFNVAAYLIDWTNIQMTVFDQNISNQTFTTNFVDARIKGIEGDVTWRATPDFTLNGAFSYNDSKLVKYRRPTQVLLPLGSPLALSPKFQFNIRARYETELSSGLRPFIQAAFHHVGSSISSDISDVSIRYQSFNPTLGYANSIPVVYNGVTVNPGDVVVPLQASLKQAAYSTVSASIGVSKDQWSLELFAENLTDKRPELYKSGNDGEVRITTSRPRTIGLRMSYKM